MGVTKPTRRQNKQKAAQLAAADDDDESIVEVDDDDGWRLDAQGKPGQEATLKLVLRVKADVGLVGLPNAGKSSLLAALTRASPEVAPYPFTTLMPNLGVLQGGLGSAAKEEDELYIPSDEELLALAAAYEAGVDVSGYQGGAVGPAPVLADLPGLIQGAHQGKGLGRMFLRHLRRTRVMVQVVDATQPDPVADYLAVREELRLYNQEYVQRPHVVALNKCDMFGAGGGMEDGGPGGLEDPWVKELLTGIEQRAREWVATVPGYARPPDGVVAVSAVRREGLENLLAVVEPLLMEVRAEEDGDSGGESD